jgi:hypothetical protein
LWLLLLTTAWLWLGATTWLLLSLPVGLLPWPRLALGLLL